MISTQSRMDANPEVSASGSPRSSMKGNVCTAAVIRAEGGSVLRRAVKKANKLWVSLRSYMLPRFPSWPGYSQSISIPSKLYLEYTEKILLIKTSRLSAVETAFEKYLEKKSIWFEDQGVPRHLLAACPPSDAQFHLGASKMGTGDQPR